MVMIIGSSVIVFVRVFVLSLSLLSSLSLLLAPVSLSSLLTLVVSLVLSALFSCVLFTFVVWFCEFPVGRTCTGKVLGCRSESGGAGMASCCGEQ